MRIEVRARCDVRTIRRVSVSFLKLANSKATDHCFCQGGSLSTNTSTYEEVRQGSQVVSRSTWKDDIPYEAFSTLHPRMMLPSSVRRAAPTL